MELVFTYHKLYCILFPCYFTRYCFQIIHMSQVPFVFADVSIFSCCNSIISVKRLNCFKTLIGKFYLRLFNYFSNFVFINRILFSKMCSMLPELNFHSNINLLENNSMESSITICHFSHNIAAFLTLAKVSFQF